MARPCEEGKYCSYEYFDHSENCTACGIDFDGESCPYIKPWGKKRYHEEQVLKCQHYSRRRPLGGER